MIESAVSNRSSLALMLILALISCSSSEPSLGSGSSNNAVVSVRDANIIEGANLIFRVTLSETSNSDIRVSYTTRGQTAEPGVDFETAIGTVDIPAGQLSAEVSVQTIDDSENELEEEISITLNDAGAARIDRSQAFGFIRDNDEPALNADGYTTAESHFGYNLVWSDEFDNGIDPNTYTFEIGDGCPNLCMWGNNELQIYSDSEENAFIRDGALVIRAQETSPAEYQSARIITKGKREFQFGRLDIRAKLPEGQGIWPAIWMLGANIDEVGWPASGEIDIMELVGHEPNTVHGTAHWGPQGQGFSTFKGDSESSARKFSEDFHVFTLLWENNSLRWHLDEEEFHTITNEDVTNISFPFNQDFFFIFNIAVGGNWPGNPDETTVFPQEMEIDYIRVFQQN